MVPDNIEKNMYLRRRQDKITLLWYPKNTDNLDFFVKSILLLCPRILKKNTKNPTMVPDNIEKNMYLRRRQDKSSLLWYPKNTDNLEFYVKITLLCCPRILRKKHVFKTSPRQNHTTMMPTRLVRHYYKLIEKLKSR